MKTTVDLPEELLNEAKKVTNLKTKRKVIIAALEQLIQRKKVSELAGFRGSMPDLEIGLDTLRQRDGIN